MMRYPDRTGIPWTTLGKALVEIVNSHYMIRFIYIYIHTHTHTHTHLCTYRDKRASQVALLVKNVGDGRVVG